MENCKTCKHGVFDEKWGEYKCEIRQIYMYITHRECADYEKKKESKE